jgi:integrase/recombinase XerC
MQLKNVPAMLHKSETIEATSIADTKYAEMLELFLAGYTSQTSAAYSNDVAQFSVFLNTASSANACQRLLSGTAAAANTLVLNYRRHLLERGLSAATVNRHLSTLRALVSLARTVGVVEWRLHARNVRSRAYRDTTGPDGDGMRALLAAAHEQADSRKAARDVALIHVMFDLALRRGEVCSLDVSDLSLDTGRLKILGKGESEPMPVAVPSATREVLSNWLSARGNEPGPLFVTFDTVRGNSGRGRLTGSGLWSIVRGLGRAANLEVRPHGLRHSSVTHALNLTNGDLRRVQRFSRHRDIRTLMMYDDNRRALAGDIAELVSLK